MFRNNNQKMLRKRLKQLTDNCDTSIHHELLVVLSGEIKNTIRLLDSEHPIDRYTCIVYVFNLVDDPEYVEIASFGIGRVFAGPEFVSFLLSNNYIERINENEASAEDIIIYFDQSEIKHAGKIKAKCRIVSKWGIGHLYEHGIFEVPEQYGGEVRFYRQLPKEEVLDYFVEFARHKGMIFEEEL